MKCKECKIVEMFVKEVKGDEFVFYCPKCKREETINKNDLKTSE